MNKFSCVCLSVLALMLSGCASTVVTSEQLKSNPEINYDLYMEALNEIDSAGLKDIDTLALIDYSKPSEKERLKVIDIQNHVVLTSSLVSHAKESGFRIPYSFSNVNGSNKSSLGLFVTGETYIGKNGYSLRISGVSEGVNTNARSRFIVVHGSHYASYGHLGRFGMLGRSKGCFALPFDKFEQVIDLIKDSGVIYVGR